MKYFIATLVLFVVSTQLFTALEAMQVEGEVQIGLAVQIFMWVILCVAAAAVGFRRVRLDHFPLRGLLLSVVYSVIFVVLTQGFLDHPEGVLLFVFSPVAILSLWVFIRWDLMLWDI